MICHYSIRVRLVVACVWLSVFLFAAAGSASAGLRFCDDFSVGSTAWRYGNAIIKADVRGMELSCHAPDVTLAGTAVNPENLRGFTATIRCNFGGKENRWLWLGWGKPFEWSAFDECVEKLGVSVNGDVTVFADGKQIGSHRVNVSGSGDVSFAICRRPEAIVFVDDGKETVFTVPGRERGAAGYFAFQARGIERRASSLRIQYVEIKCNGDAPPLSEAQRLADNQSWAKRRLHGNLDVLGVFEQHLKTEAAAGRWGFNTDLRVEPGLVRPGETVRAVFRCVGPLPPQCEARAEPNFLSGSGAGSQGLELKWHEKSGGFEAVVELKPKQCGNWRITWQAGSERLSRVFGVVDRGYVVCRFLVTNDKALNVAGSAPAGYDLIHEFGLAADHWDGAEWVSPFSRTPEGLVAHFKRRADLKHCFGDHFMPMCNANWMLPGCPDTNLWRFDDDVQRDGLKQIARLWNLLGLGPMDVLASYTFGHSTPRIASSVGVKMIDSLVQWQNWRDGGDNNAWLINQCGAPTVPYYVATDDFRKVAPRRSIVAFTQATTSSVRLYYINTLEGQPQLAFMRRHRSEDMAEKHNADRFQAAVDLWLAEAPYQSEPMFVSVGLENFVDSADWNEANRSGVRYACEQARSRNIVFSQADDIADFYQRHYPHQPESWFYWPDIYAGYQAGYKPRLVPDRIEVSNANFHSLHEDGSVLPRFVWDYTRCWNEPVWDDQPEIRQKFGLPTPELLNATNSVPRTVNLDGVKATVELETQPGGIAVRVRVDSPRDLDSLPLAVWRIPLLAESCEAVETSRGIRFIRVVDGSTGNLHGLLVCRRVPKGIHSWTVRLRGNPRPPSEPNFRIGEEVCGRAFQSASGPVAYVWLSESSKQAAKFNLTVPSGRQVSVHYNDGRVEQPREGVLAVEFDLTWRCESPMISGLTAGEIMAAFVKK